MLVTSRTGMFLCFLASDYTRLHLFSIPNIRRMLAGWPVEEKKIYLLQAYPGTSIYPSFSGVYFFLAHNSMFDYKSSSGWGLVISGSHRIRERHRHLHVLFNIISHMHRKLENIQMANFNILIIIQC